jgi:pimeloyl-ACP methyl ester carboxylesterase
LYREKFPQFLLSLPFRASNLLSRHVSVSRNIPYWYRPHTSKTKLPILFIHGIGIGLLPYLNFLSDIYSQLDDEDGQVGIIILELLPISSRITTPLPLSESLRSQILAILDFHGWNKLVLAVNSYGSMVATQLLHDARIEPRIGPILFMDPVVFLLHLPDVAHNFVARKPFETIEFVLWYFAGKDPLVAHTLQRRSFWVEDILWKEELKGRDVTIALAGNDAIVNTRTVRKYLLGANAWEGNEAWSGEGLDLLWFEGFNHAEMFHSKRSYRMLTNVLDEYTRKVSTVEE